MLIKLYYCDYNLITLNIVQMYIQSKKMLNKILCTVFLELEGQALKNPLLIIIG